MRCLYYVSFVEIKNISINEVLSELVSEKKRIGIKKEHESNDRGTIKLRKST